MCAEGVFHAYIVGRGRRTSLFVGLVAAATTTATTLTTEAIAAVDGPAETVMVFAPTILEIPVTNATKSSDGRSQSKSQSPPAR